MTGPQLLGLLHPVERVVIQRIPNFIGTVAYHHVNGVGIQLPGGLHHVLQHGSARHRVQHLG